MMRAMFSAVSGVRSHQTQMDVIGNNIANVNTTGFKAGRVNFRDLFSQTLQGATAPTATRGGTNPMQVGLGVTLSSIDTLHTPGSTQSTGVTTDLAIDGDGFFVVQGPTQTLYTRAGLFDLEAEYGRLVMKGTGYRVQGWMADANGNINTQGSIGDLFIDTEMTIPPRATTNVTFGGNLDPDTQPGDFVEVLATVRDSLGRPVQIILRFTKSTAPGQWDWAAYQPNGSAITGWSGTLTFDPQGRLSTATNTSVSGYQPNADAAALSLTLDFSGLTQRAGFTTAEMTWQDGRAAGEFETFDIDSNGVIRGIFSNGEMRNLGQIALARFANPGGLAKAGDTTFAATANSGEARIGAAGERGRGMIIPGALEMSNVDLSQEFTNMIISQRGFQANARTITTSDELLQELVNLKR